MRLMDVLSALRRVDRRNVVSTQFETATPGLTCEPISVKVEDLYYHSFDMWRRVVGFRLVEGVWRCGDLVMQTSTRWTHVDRYVSLLITRS